MYGFGQMIDELLEKILRKSFSQKVKILESWKLLQDFLLVTF